MENSSYRCSHLFLKKPGEHPIWGFKGKSFVPVSMPEQDISPLERDSDYPLGGDENELFTQELEHLKEDLECQLVDKEFKCTPEVGRVYRQVVRKIFDLSKRGNLSFLTINFSVALFATYLQKLGAVEDKELIAIVFILIASKYNETDVTGVSINTLREQAITRYSREELIKTEKVALEFLNWNLNVLTPYHFLLFYEKSGLCFKSDLMGPKNYKIENLSPENLTESIITSSIAYLDQTLHNPLSITTRPDYLALCCIIQAKKDLDLTFSDSITTLFQITPSLLTEIFVNFHEFPKKTGANSYLDLP